MRALRFCPRVSMGSGSHARLIGKKASGHTIPDGFPYRDACAGAYYGIRLKGSHQNHPESLRHMGNVQTDEEQASHNIKTGHHRHKLFHH